MKEKKLTRLLIALWILFAITLWADVRDGKAQDGKSFLWRVQAGKPTVYLLGSVHFLKKENYPLNPKIEKAFEESDTMLVEANINEQANADMLMILEKGLYPENDTLKAHVSPETYRLIQEEAQRTGIPLDLIDKQRPWFLALTFTGLELLKSGFDPRYGVDHYFLSKAGKQKRILELESVDYQIKLLSGFPDRDQELFLLFTLKDLKKVGQEVDKLLAAWASGDTKAMESMILRHFREDKRLLPIYEKLFDERNKKMAADIEFYLKTTGTYFVVVGAGHLIGEKGIVQLLKEKGYQVEQF
jgi:uncharacterized protein